MTFVPSDKVIIKCTCGCGYKGALARVDSVIDNSVYVLIHGDTKLTVFKPSVLELTILEHSHGKNNAHFGQGLPV